MLGCATNGFCVLIIQSIVLLVMDRKDVTKASYVYFITCAIILFICLVLFRNMLRYPLVDDKLNPKEEEKPKKKKKLTSLNIKFQEALRKKIGFKYHDTFANIHGAVISFDT